MKDDAVSPVIGVLILAAIATLLAVGVYLSGQNFGDNARQSASVSFVKGQEGELIVHSFWPGNLDWSQLAVTGCMAPAMGMVEAGQLMTDCSGLVTIVYEKDENVIYNQVYEYY